jgi:hypothetical protein
MCICSLHYIRHASVTRDKGVSVGCGDTACQIQSKLIPVLFSDRSMKTGTTFFLCNHLLYGLVIGTISSTTSRAIKDFTNSGRGLAHTWRSPGPQHIASLAKLCAIPLQALGIEMTLLHTKCSFNKSRVSLINIPHAARSMDGETRTF